MNKAVEISADFSEPCVAAAVQEAVELAKREAKRDSMPETAGISAADFFSDEYWERRCHQLEEQLQALARELERKCAIIEDRQCAITHLEMDNRMLSAQLDIVHLIFGAK